jgi:hypothetical protein
MSVTQTDDKVWFDAAHKVQQIAAQTRLAASNRQNVLLLAHFETTLSALSEPLRGYGVEYERFSLFDSTALCAGATAKVWVGPARAFQAPKTFPLERVSSSPLQIIVAEHHPKQSRDQAIIEAANGLSCPGELCFHFSLDDPLLKHFGGPSLQGLFERLGMAGDSCITHPLVTSAIRNAQAKIEKEVPVDLQTESIGDWFKYNLERKP